MVLRGVDGEGREGGDVFLREVALLWLVVACVFWRVAGRGFWKARMEGCGEGLVVCYGCLCVV